MLCLWRSLRAIRIQLTSGVFGDRQFCIESSVARHGEAHACTGNCRAKEHPKIAGSTLSATMTTKPLDAPSRQLSLHSDVRCDAHVVPETSMLQRMTWSYSGGN